MNGKKFDILLLLSSSLSSFLIRYRGINKDIKTRPRIRYVKKRGSIFKNPIKFGKKSYTTIRVNKPKITKFKINKKDTPFQLF